MEKINTGSTVELKKCTWQMFFRMRKRRLQRGCHQAQVLWRDCRTACIARICFCFDSVGEESLRKIKNIWGFAGLKYKLMVKTGIL